MIRFLGERRLLQLLGFGLLLFSMGTHFLRATEKKEKKPSAAEQPTSTFRVNVNLVSVNVTVTDRRGVPIPDLTEKDFQVLDNGVSQKIAVFRMVTIPGNVVSGPNARPTSPTPPAPTTTSRKVILFVDDYNTSFEDLVYVRKAGEQFIRTGLGATDLVALITASGRHSTELTFDRESVIANLRLVLPFFADSGGRETCPPVNEYQALLIQRDLLTHDKWDSLIAAASGCCFMCPRDALVALIRAAANRLAFRSEDLSRRLLSSLQTLTRRLSAIEGPKELLFLSTGFLLGVPITGELEYEMNRAIDSAIRANTVIDSVNAAGLVPDISASSRLPESDAADFRFAREDPLSALATETGGKLYHNSNDLFALMQTAIRRSSVNYILRFYSSDERHNGQFHKLVVKVDRAGVSVAARKGYFAPKGEESFEALNSETIRDALEAAQELKGVPVALSFNITHEETPESLVEVRTRIDVKKMRFRKEKNRNQEIFSMVTIVYDSNHQFVDGREARLDFSLTDPHYQDILRAGLVWAARFKLPSGHYMVKTVVREAGESKLGSAVGTLDVLN